MWGHSTIQSSSFLSILEHSSTFYKNRKCPVTESNKGLKFNQFIIDKLIVDAFEIVENSKISTTIGYN